MREWVLLHKLRVNLFSLTKCTKNVKRGTILSNLGSLLMTYLRYSKTFQIQAVPNFIYIKIQSLFLTTSVAAKKVLKYWPQDHGLRPCGDLLQHRHQRHQVLWADRHEEEQLVGWPGELCSFCLGAKHTVLESIWQAEQSYDYIFFNHGENGDQMRHKPFLTLEILTKNISLLCIFYSRHP